MQKLTMDEMERLSGEAFKEAPKMNVTIVLDDVRSMMNTGSIFRTADAFRAGRICLCGITATPPHREIHKTALGATESVVWEYHASCADLLKHFVATGAEIVAVEQTHCSIKPETWQPDPDKELVLVFGNEVNGISEEALMLCRYALEIPQYGTKHSLNIAVTAGIILWETFQRLKSQLE
jgi:23S rRNA (guanosine2251-2'-O)-methyltransferase